MRQYLWRSQSHSHVSCESTLPSINCKHIATISIVCSERCRLQIKNHFVIRSAVIAPNKQPVDCNSISLKTNSVRWVAFVLFRCRAQNMFIIDNHFVVLHQVITVPSIRVDLADFFFFYHAFQNWLCCYVVSFVPFFFYFASYYVCFFHCLEQRNFILPFSYAVNEWIEINRFSWILYGVFSIYHIYLNYWV